MYVGRMEGKQQLKDMGSEVKNEGIIWKERYNRYKDGSSPALDSWHLKRLYSDNVEVAVERRSSEVQIEPEGSEVLCLRISFKIISNFVKTKF